MSLSSSATPTDGHAPGTCCRQWGRRCTTKAGHGRGRAAPADDRWVSEARKTYGIAARTLLIRLRAMVCAGGGAASACVRGAPRCTVRHHDRAVCHCACCHDAAAAQRQSWPPSLFATAARAGRPAAHTHGLAGSRTSDETCRCGLANSGEGDAAARRRSARRGKAWRDAEQVVVCAQRGRGEGRG